MPQPAETDTDVDDAFVKFEALLLAIAGGVSPNRSEATRYSACRALLLGSAYRSHLPGFVHQCMSVFRFGEFISLYDPSPQTREAFVRASLKPARVFREDRLSFDIVRPPARSREWTL